MRKYQLNYSSNRPQMFDSKSRIEKAERIIKTLKNYYGKRGIKKLKALDVGASTGIIDNYIADYLDQVIGIDIDRKGILFAKKNYKKQNLNFQVGDALNLDFPNNHFDILICTHIYEHVSDPKKLLKEIFRVLKPHGICYFAAINSLWPIEPHYGLPFLSYLPKKIANIYVKIFNKSNFYYETPLNFWQLENLTHNFKKIDYTPIILENPKKFGYSNTIIEPIQPLIGKLSPVLKYFTPTFFWILIKNE